MVKNYVIDSSVLLYYADSILCFADNIVIVPEVVTAELKSLAQENSNLGDSARRSLLLLNHLMDRGKKGKPVRLLNGGLFKTEMNHDNQKLPAQWEPQEYDHRLLQVCLALQAAGDDVVLVSMDVLTRFKADILGISSQEFDIGVSPEIQDQYPSYRMLESISEVEAFLKKGYINPERVHSRSNQLMITPRRWQVKQQESCERVKKSG